MSDVEILDEFFKNTPHMVVAVVLPSSKPWAVPVHIKHREGRKIFEWDSNPEAVHSKAIASNPDIAITMYYMNTGFYAHAKAEVVPDIVDDEGRWRYRAVTEQCWLNDNYVKREVPVE